MEWVCKWCEERAQFCELGATDLPCAFWQTLRRMQAMFKEGGLASAGLENALIGRVHIAVVRGGGFYGEPPWYRGSSNEEQSSEGGGP